MKEFIKSFAVSFIVAAVAALLVAFDVLGAMTMPPRFYGVVPWMIVLSIIYASVREYSKSQRRARDIEGRYKERISELEQENRLLKAPRTYDDVRLKMTREKLELLTDEQRFILEDLLFHGESERKHVARRHKMSVSEIHAELREIETKTQLVTARVVSGSEVLWKVNDQFFDVLIDELPRRQT